jgi:general stress protein 26
MAASNGRRKATEKKTGSREELWKLVDGIETAMMTTRGRDGMLVSRPMATQKRASGADFWFVTLRGPKVEEIEADPRINLSYYRDRTREWVSVSGEAEISKDRAKIRELYAPDWKAWFPNEGGKKDGGPDDPRILLIGVNARSAQYMTVDKPQPVVFFEFLKGMVTGKAADFGEVKRVSLRGGASRSRAKTSRRSSGRKRSGGRV